MFSILPRISKVAEQVWALNCLMEHMIGWSVQSAYRFDSAWGPQSIANRQGFMIDLELVRTTSDLPPREGNTVTRTITPAR
ncbi:hypothetical protein [Parasedimentitalea huanghaiensis]|uniref:Uncharacterized protein n=1 Tax=Parasedimentitalea huanghaiensis TaxID=2682100 RepID=A0A6L6WAU7_9RHOB|nr:hypothetical protein [Zongyanglinia huanghaiensis]MVO14700.1 hypothetical protein [Zongyanglinia huanghaiensis]